MALITQRHYWNAHVFFIVLQRVQMCSWQARAVPHLAFVILLVCCTVLLWLCVHARVSYSSVTRAWRRECVLRLCVHAWWGRVLLDDLCRRSGASVAHVYLSSRGGGAWLPWFFNTFTHFSRQFLHQSMSFLPGRILQWSNPHLVKCFCTINGK